ncbi:unnamed protein product [Echinostoma caproni]|uniref:Uncharacterized protein n=1 Tax=Echinostoma caproni TaxID=27848 RepID=A0A3P8L6M9_9TREM|nr:unnamed protein product [Echinostoma caproni]
MRDFPRTYLDQLSICLTALIRQKKAARAYGSANFKRQISAQYHRVIHQLKPSLGKKDYNHAVQEARERLRNPDGYLDFWHLLHSPTYAQ